LTDESIRTVPAAVTVFTREQIRRMGIDSLHELLNLVPGYQVQRVSDNPFRYSYSARGRRNGNSSKEILLLVDGRLVNDTRTGSANGAMADVPLVQIERVEVIRGPGSAIYGSNAYTGVINVITRRSVNEVGIGAGSQDMGQMHAFLSQSGHSWQFDAFVQTRRDDGEKYEVYDNFSRSQINTRDPRSQTDLDAALRYRDALVRAQHRVSKGDDFFTLGFLSNGFNRAYMRYSQITLEQDAVLGQVNSHWYLGYQQASLELDTQLTRAGALAAASSPSSSDPLLVKPIFDSSAWQFRWHNDWQQSKVSRFQFGLDWRRESEDKAYGRNNFDVAQLASRDFPINYYGDFDQGTQIGTLESRDVLGAYGQYQYHWIDQDVRVTLGFRFDDYDQVGSRVSPRLGLVKQLAEHHTVKLLYGQAFRAPAMNETGLINNLELVGNPDLEHELVRTWDLIWLGHWKTTQAKVGWFQSQYSDPIIPDTIGATRTFVNGPDEDNQGIELELTRQISASWMVGAGLTHFIDLPDSSFRRSENLASAQLDFVSGRWGWNLIAVYHDETQMQFGEEFLTLDAYWLLNSRIRYQVSRQINLWMQAKNLLDDDYFAPTEGKSLREGLPNRRLEWVAGVEFGF
jgi:iron complex outermembrane receptor protein